MKKLAFLFTFSCFSCFGAVTAESYSQFMKEYTSSVEKKDFAWPEIAYAIEKDYDDELVLFVIENAEIYSANYRISQEDKFRWYYKNLFMTCIIKNKLEFIDPLIKKLPPNSLTYAVEFTSSMGGALKCNERPLLSKIVDEIDDPLKYVEYLVDRGAQVDIVIRNSSFPDPYFDWTHTPLQLAFNKQKFDVAAFLISRGADKRLGLISAVQNNNFEAVVFMLNNKAPVTQETIDMAIKTDNAEILNLVLDEYYNGLSKDGDKGSFEDFIKSYLTSAEKKNLGWSEVVYAIEKDYDDALILFCIENFNILPNKQYQKDTNFDYWHHVGFTALKKGKTDAFYAMVNKYPGFIAEASEKWTVLFPHKNFEAPILNKVIEDIDDCLEIVKYMADNGADINKNYSNNIWNVIPTPLEVAIRANKLDVAEFLLERGTISKEPPLLIAVENSNKEAVILLLNHGAIPNKYIVDLAFKKGDAEIADLIMKAYFKN